MNIYEGHDHCCDDDCCDDDCCDHDCCDEDDLNDPVIVDVPTDLPCPAMVCNNDVVSDANCKGFSSLSNGIDGWLEFLKAYDTPGEGMCEETLDFCEFAFLMDCVTLLYPS